MATSQKKEDQSGNDPRDRRRHVGLDRTLRRFAGVDSVRETDAIADWRSAAEASVRSSLGQFHYVDLCYEVASPPAYIGTIKNMAHNTLYSAMMGEAFDVMEEQLSDTTMRLWAVRK